MLSLGYYLQAIRENQLVFYVNSELTPPVSFVRQDQLISILGQYYTLRSSGHIWSLQEVLENIMENRGMIKRASVKASGEDKFVQFAFTDVLRTQSLYHQLQTIVLFGWRASRYSVLLDFPLIQGRDDRYSQKKLEAILHKEGFRRNSTLVSEKILPYFYIKEGKMKILQAQCLMFPERAIQLSLAIFRDLLQVSSSSTYEVTLFED